MHSGKIEKLKGQLSANLKDQRATSIKVESIYL